MTIADDFERSHEPAATARYPLLLLAAFAPVFGLLAIAPETREDWLLENLLVFATLAWLLLGWHHHRLSNSAYTLLFVFGVIHEIGAHYQ